MPDGQFEAREHEVQPVQPSAGPAGPRTYVGLWLRALMRGDVERYRLLVHTLNRGQKGWNDDEPAVLEAACEIAVRQYFSVHYNVSPAVFSADMRFRIGKSKVPPAQADLVAVIDAALNESALSREIRRGELVNIRVAITGNISDILKLDDGAIDRLVGDAETIAVSRGYNPPLAVDS